MKLAKKLASLLLALVMVLSMSAIAFASDPTEAPTEQPTENVHTYEVYQIFTGTFVGEVLSDVKWGVNGTGKTGEDVKYTVLDALEAVKTETSDAKKLDVIKQYFKKTSQPVATGTATKYEGLADGYYLVKDQDGTQNKEDGSYTLYVVQVVKGVLEFTPKDGVPTVEKKIVEGDQKLDNNDASIGDVVNYEITGTLPDKIAEYKTYYYVFTDTLSRGLDYNNDLKVYIDGKELTGGFYKDATDYDAENGTTITVGFVDLLAIQNLVGENIVITKDTKIVFKYSATLNENAVIAGAGNKNDVQLQYANNPNDSGDKSTTPPPDNPDTPVPTHPTGVTPKDEVFTYTTGLTILKTNEEGQFLPGVEFTLTGDGVNIVLVATDTFTEDANGEYWKLADGTYTTEAPVVSDDPDIDNTKDYARACLKKASCQVCVPLGGRFSSNEGGVAGYVDRI